MKYVVAFRECSRTARRRKVDGGFDLGELVRLHRVCLTEAAAARLAVRANHSTWSSAAIAALIRALRRRPLPRLPVRTAGSARFRKPHPVTNEAPMTDPDSAASPSDERGRIAQFPLSRVTEVFHDGNAGCSSPGPYPQHCGFFSSLRSGSRGHPPSSSAAMAVSTAMLRCAIPRNWITSARIAAYDVDNPYAVELAGIPMGQGGCCVTRHRLLELGAGPANEPCAQLGRTPISSASAEL